MKIQILGGGCPNCEALAKHAVEAGERLGIDVEIEKVTDSDAIMEMGVLRTPGYAIEGELRGSGKVFSAEEIATEMEKAR